MKTTCLTLVGVSLATFLFSAGSNESSWQRSPQAAPAIPSNQNVKTDTDYRKMPLYWRDHLCADWAGRVKHRIGEARRQKINSQDWRSYELSRQQENALLSPEALDDWTTLRGFAKTVLY